MGEPQNKGTQKWVNLEIKMTPKRTRKRSSFGDPGSAKSNVFPYVFSQTGHPMGPRFPPKMSSELSQNRYQL